MKLIDNNRGISLIGVLIACAIVLIVAVVGMKFAGKRIKDAGDAAGVNLNNPTEAKKRAIGSNCSFIIKTIAQGAEAYRAVNGQIPLSMSQIVDMGPQLEQSISNSEVWVADGNPVYESALDRYTITGYCADGNMYVYSSEKGSVLSEPFGN